MTLNLTTTTVRTKDAIQLIFRTNNEHYDVIPGYSKIDVALSSVDLENGIAEASWKPANVGPAIEFPIQIGVDLIDTDYKLLVLNASGFFFRDDTEQRKEDPDLYDGFVEAYSLYTSYDRVGFRRHAVYAGSHAFAVESAYQDMILSKQADQDIAEDLLEVYVKDLTKLGVSRDRIVEVVDGSLQRHEYEEKQRREYEEKQRDC